MLSLISLLQMALQLHLLHSPCVIIGNPSITLRHRLICEIRARKKVPLPSSTDVCSLDPTFDGPSSQLMKFPTKLILPADDLKTKMLVRKYIALFVAHGIIFHF